MISTEWWDYHSYNYGERCIVFVFASAARVDFIFTASWLMGPTSMPGLVKVLQIMHPMQVKMNSRACQVPWKPDHDKPFWHVSAIPVVPKVFSTYRGCRLNQNMLNSNMIKTISLRIISSCNCNQSIVCKKYGRLFSACVHPTTRGGQSLSGFGAIFSPRFSFWAFHDVIRMQNLLWMKITNIDVKNWGKTNFCLFSCHFSERGECGHVPWIGVFLLWPVTEPHPEQQRRDHVVL